MTRNRTHTARTANFSRRLAGVAAVAAASMLAVAPAAGAATKAGGGARPETVTGKDKGTVFFVSNRADGNQPQIFKLNRNTKQVAQLTSSPDNYMSPSVGGSGQKVAFSSAAPVLHAKWKLELMNNDGSGRHVVLHDTGAQLVDPSLNPAGTKIAFTRIVGTDQQIWTVNTDGTGLTQLTKAGEGINRVPSWSPDGQQIAFVSSRYGYSEVYTMNAAGQAINRITYEQSGVGDPDWSPDGKRIVYSHADGSYDVTIKAVEVHTVHTPYVVSAGSGSTDENPTWCPDNKAIIFTASSSSGDALMAGNVSGDTPYLVTGKGSNYDADCGLSKAPPVKAQS